MKEILKDIQLDTKKDLAVCMAETPTKDSINKYTVMVLDSFAYFLEPKCIPMCNRNASGKCPACAMRDKVKEFEVVFND